MTKKFKLTNTYLVGNEAIDADHQHLVDAIDGMREILANGHRQEFPVRFAEFIDLAGAHFGREEKLLFELGFPGASDHADFHGVLMAEAKELQAQLTTRVDTLDADSFYKRMLAFLIHDFVRKDLEFKSYLQEHR